MKECQLCKNCFADAVVTCPNDGMPTVHTISGEPVLEGKYQLECRLGQGGMGVVYKARHAYLKTQLAIKVILPDLVGNDPQLVTRFRQEALAAAAIRHQNVVSVTDYGVIDGTLPFLVMEYVEGEALHDLLAREKSLSPERTFELMSAVCAGVGAAHHQGIVHRDLKPLNIMICNDKPNLSQAVKILDFGLAKIKSGELLGSFIQAQTTGLMGSPYYMAPEQWADEDPDSRSDIYSLGVMLYQMLTGDVPFKGSSIPAIMKKHISDAAPTLADAGLHVSPELEQAVLHTLQKDPEKRTQTVDILVEELRAAIKPGVQFIHTAPVTLPVSSLKLTTKPPQSSVFVDNIAMGRSTENGLLLIEGLQSGNHHLRVTHNGFRDWTSDVICDGRPVEVVADLSTQTLNAGTGNAIPMPDVTIGGVHKTIASSGQNADEMAQTVQQDYSPSRFNVQVDTAPPPKKSSSKTLLFGIGGLLALFLIGIAGVGAAWMLGAFDRNVVIGPATPTPTPTATPGPVPAITPDMAQIPGGTFKMGLNSGPEMERPEHDVTVKAFAMDKTEVTNEEYFAFTRETGYKPLPIHWTREETPPPGQEKYPVRSVNIADVNAFIAWRSKRDGVQYRLPTESEWEFAARNGSKENVYPWGNKPQDECAVLGKSIIDPSRVATNSCPNDWGVHDLIGNVFEWTSSPAAPYPGSRKAEPSKEPEDMVRGGCANNTLVGEKAVTSTSRLKVPTAKRDGQLGFRLVK
ncbi:MAG: bifunctional serine/threonine-protein kinase/formylglycine-generating enzyme family protein [Pyrinomonadaceae bacterium]